MPSEIYQQAQYYEIAMSFVDVPKQIDLFEAYIRDHSAIPVQRVLDICCGPSPQLREFVRRGYQAIGLDASRPMLDYLEAQAACEGIQVETVYADMREFSLDQPVDFCYILLGTLPYVGSRQGLLSHLSCVAQALRPGGIYLIENLLMDWVSTATPQQQDWTMEREGITVHSHYQLEVLDPLAQTARHVLEFIVDDHGKPVHLGEDCVVPLFFPQEFISLVELQGAFEFVGFFDRDSTEPLRKLSCDNIVVLRRR
ncbi:MAG: class I SAM-dependent methyltransferase [Armatimonadota bacterium]